ncbi:type II secretion system protein [Clostridium sp. Cult2]|uniref:type II secretion system protein n=1 Tax=Clostridium sp. Cult2 TaxID=2079003 RepID=UPI0023511117|nr:prepilin-type N-terminal cleavage/methylation domain-containing protein [Clostridium sp. Cult2]MCF6465641.1 prepilin-type cleavage/methylation domain-containing protein [Clostridium sp. Cult2]
MFQWILKRIKKNNKGFTLVELVVVIAILGILAGIAVPRLGASRKRAAITAHNANVRTLISAANMYIADNDVPSDNNVVWTGEEGEGKDETWKGYLQDWPEVPKGLEDNDGTAITGPYQVTIYTNGDITVEPVTIPTSDNSEQDPS